MLRETLTLSGLICAVLLVRALFRNRIPKRMVYALWLLVLLKLCLPGTPVFLAVLPALETPAPVSTGQTVLAEQPALVETSSEVQASQTAKPAQMPEAVPEKNPERRALSGKQIFYTGWAAGSVLMALWIGLSGAVFGRRLRKSRRLLETRDGVRIYCSGAVKTPCLAGFPPAVYLTEQAVGTEAKELILRHELTHLRHLDPVWSGFRMAAVCVYWWNPFVWASAALSRRDAELACDEAVAAKLDGQGRLQYARTIVELSSRKARAALALTNPPVRERVLFLTKKRKTSALCGALALILALSATGCSLTRLTRRPGERALETEENREQPRKTMVSLPQKAADWAASYLPESYEVLDSSTVTSGEKSWVLLLAGGKAPRAESFTDYQVYALEEQESGYTLGGVSRAQDFDPAAEMLACSMVTEDFGALYGFTTDRASRASEQADGAAFDALTAVFQDGSRETVSIEPGKPFLRVFPGRGKEIENAEFSVGEQTADWSAVSGKGLRESSEGELYTDDSLWAKVHNRLDGASWAQELTPDSDYEAAIQAFEIEDSKRSDVPGDVSQWPHYYSAFLEFFGGMNAPLAYLDREAAWTLELADEGETLLVTMRWGNEAQTFAYSRKTQAIQPAVMILRTYGRPMVQCDTVSAEDAAALAEVFDLGAMAPAGDLVESVCVYEFEAGDGRYMLDDSLSYLEAVVHPEPQRYEYYARNLTDAEIAVLKTVIGLPEAEDATTDSVG